MGFFDSDPHTETKHKWLIATAAVVAGLGFLSVGNNETPLSPSARYAADYASGGNTDCFSDSPYNPSEVLVRKDKSGTIIVKPVKSSAPELEFKGYSDQKTSLLPADNTTKQIFSDYDCKIQHFS